MFTIGLLFYFIILSFPGAFFAVDVRVAEEFRDIRLIDLRIEAGLARLTIKSIGLIFIIRIFYIKFLATAIGTFHFGTPFFELDSVKKNLSRYCINTQYNYYVFIYKLNDKLLPSEKIMENKLNNVGPLKKVSLVFTAGTRPESYDLIATPQPLEFIAGIGTEGLTQLECALDGKQSGDKGMIEVDSKNMAEIFGHIIPCTDFLPIHSRHFYFQYVITGISDASPREVVKSMAAATGGGCSDGCDCGCGSH